MTRLSKPVPIRCIEFGFIRSVYIMVRVLSLHHNIMLKISSTTLKIEF